MPRRPKGRRYFKGVKFGAVLVTTPPTPRPPSSIPLWGEITTPMTALLLRSPDLPVKWCAKLPIDAVVKAKMCGGAPMDAVLVRDGEDEFGPAFGL
jgi:hypothetical protein